MFTLTVLVGLQCSGKSTWANNFKENLNAIVLSSDETRKQNPDWDNEKVFKHLYSQMNELLKTSNVILDATNITIKSRRKLLNELKTPCIKKCLIFNADFKECLERLEERNKNPESHYVSKDVLTKYLHSFEIPFKEEGWDEIQIKDHPNKILGMGWLGVWFSSTHNFDQHNYHHTQNLEEHLITTKNSLEQALSKIERHPNPILVKSALFHDLGKLWTQTFKPDDPNAHYYNHANVGAYNILCNSGIYLEEDGTYLENATLDFIFYINYHMHMYNINNDKAKRKWRDIFGETKYKYLVLLNEADKSNHRQGE